MTHHPVDVHVGRRVRVARIANGLSQTQLGDALRVAFQQVQKYEKGTNRISCSRLAEIAKTLHHDVAWFFEGAPDASLGKTPAASAFPPLDTMDRLAATRSGVALATAFVAIHDKDMQDAIVAMAEAAARKTAERKGGITMASAAE